VGFFPPETEVMVVLRLRFRGQARGDIDNYAKLILDALTESGVWADDSQVKELMIGLLEREPVNSIVIVLDELSVMREGGTDG
jgi:Holliday junction resolvase RusA-like endonuclease